MRVLIHLNDETGKDMFSVECDDDVGNWLDSFETLDEAEHFINARLMLHTHATDFRDTRTTPNVEVRGEALSRSIPWNDGLGVLRRTI